MELMSNQRFLSQAASVGPLQVLHGALPLGSLLLFWEGLELLLIIGRVANQAAFLTLWHSTDTIGKAYVVQPTLSAAASIRRSYASYVWH